jgi:hypothetical protein
MGLNLSWGREREKRWGGRRGKSEGRNIISIK